MLGQKARLCLTVFSNITVQNFAGYPGWAWEPFLGWYPSHQALRLDHCVAPGELCEGLSSTPKPQSLKGSLGSFQEPPESSNTGGVTGTSSPLQLFGGFLGFHGTDLAWPGSWHSERFAFCACAVQARRERTKRLGKPMQRSFCRPMASAQERY